ncbi:MAG: replication protein RepA [Steroidobacteraceae bacterium]
MTETGELDDLAAFDKAARIFADIRLSPELIVTQLLRAGFPAEFVRARYPSVAESYFVTVPTNAKLRASLYARHSGAGTGSRAPPLPPSAQALTQRVLAKIASPAPTLAASAHAQPILPHPGEGADLSEGVSFQYVPLIQCSFPHADPGAQTSFTRRNGWLELTLSTARPETGLPYGVPARLLTIYCASEAIRTRSPEIYLGQSVHEFLRLLDVPITRGERGSLRVYANQLLRLIHCALSIDENIRDAQGRTGLHIRQALFVEEARLWWDERDGVGQGSSLVLSPVLYDSILERSAPLSTKAIRQLRKSPMDLDVYAWLVHRLFALNRPSIVTWPQLSAQFGHSYEQLRFFRRFFSDSVARVLKVYPEARLKLEEGGVTLLPSRPHVPRESVAR